MEGFQVSKELLQSKNRMLSLRRLELLSKMEEEIIEEAFVAPAEIKMKLEDVVAQIRLVIEAEVNYFQANL